LIAGLGASLREVADRVAAHPLVSTFRRYWRDEYGLALVAVVSGLVAWTLINLPDKYPDFTVLHAAATHAFGPVYDSEFLTSLQLHAEGEQRPFAYPPTFLAMLLPLGLLGFKPAYVAWVSLSLTSYMAAATRLTKLGWLALYGPTLLFVTMIGQTTLLLGALLISGFHLIDRRPTWSGIAFGLAACIKPHLLLLVPIALLMERRWHVIVTAALTGLALAAVATVMFGISIWSDWAGSLNAFVAINDRLDIRRLGLVTGSIWQVLALVAALFLMWRAAGRDRSKLMLAAIGGGMLIAPHAPFYESAMLIAPALAAAAWNWRLLPAGWLLLGGGTDSLSLAAILLLLCAPIERWRAPSSFARR
jgi:hypothetical protein